ncbi:HNH endonuclease [Oscillochloris sp. ZM17-4]|jgi:hypothetical protein|uniref:HNH endonuclease n=1 Tax=Oscillochloris sp. ZM17-4 TaxID=2866714 RepID=UPI002104FBF8|nr:HNH endonuclease signature motif containing protein [Oscillochloris sp. ZM17-4]
MSLAADLRAGVRERFAGCCGYCGVSEADVGNDLEIDHYRPRAHGGGDDLDNLVYTCSACNRFKSAYWPGDDAPDDLRLLNPNRDDLSAHIDETVSGRLVGLTPRGWLHIRWLHLNRPLLVALRQRRQRAQLIAEGLSQAQDSAAFLQQRVAVLERELADLRAIVQRLAGLSDPQ